jgi:hypothetical protein
MASIGLRRYKGTLNLPLPDGWFAKESITALAPDGQANLIASSEPLDPSIDSERYARVQGELLEREFPGYRQFSFEPTMAFGRRGGFLRRFEWVPPDGLAVMQIQVYYAEAGRGYTATGTSPATEFSRYERDLVRMFEGLTID